MTKVGTHAPHRLVAIDVARAIALIGIMINHIMAPKLQSAVWWDFHAIGFCFLIGVGATYSVAHATDKRVAVLRALVRAVVLAAFGFTLENLPNGGVAVILVRLAIVTGLTALLALLPRRTLAWLSWVLLAVLPVVGALMMWTFTDLFVIPQGWLTIFHPGAWLAILFAPFHPAIQWTAIACLGLWVSQRFDLGAQVTHVKLALIGLGMAVTGVAIAALAWLVGGKPEGWTFAMIADGDYSMTTDPRWALQVGAYLPTTPSYLFSTGVVIMALVGVCWLVNRWPHWRGWAPMATIGAMTFSAYFIHVLMEGASAALTANGLWSPQDWLRFGIELALLVGFLLAWSKIPGRLGKGPLEWLSRAAASAVVPARRTTSVESQRP